MIKFRIKKIAKQGDFLTIFIPKVYYSEIDREQPFDITLKPVKEDSDA